MLPSRLCRLSCGHGGIESLRPKGKCRYEHDGRSSIKESKEPRVYPHRVAGGDRDHRDPDCVVAAGGAAGAEAARRRSARTICIRWVLRCITISIPIRGCRQPVNSRMKRSNIRQFFPVSFFTSILPFIDQANVSNAWNYNYHYTAPVNQAAARTYVAGFLCPSGTTGPDSLGYGRTDYMPIAYCDFDYSGFRGGSSAYSSHVAGIDKSGLLGPCNKIALATDGLSNTIAVIEDAGRPDNNGGSYDISGNALLGQPAGGRRPATMTRLSWPPQRTQLPQMLGPLAGSTGCSTVGPIRTTVVGFPARRTTRSSKRSTRTRPRQAALRESCRPPARRIRGTSTTAARTTTFQSCTRP